MQCREGSEGVDDALAILGPGSVSSSSVCSSFLKYWGGLQFPKATESVSFHLFHVDSAC